MVMLAPHGGWPVGYAHSHSALPRSQVQGQHSQLCMVMLHGDRFGYMVMTERLVRWAIHTACLEVSGWRSLHVPRSELRGRVQEGYMAVAQSPPKRNTKVASTCV